ncbi:GerMN domain-containing protein [bacterium]|nr:GerMN domain-containing protein [bacterium]
MNWFSKTVIALMFIICCFWIKDTFFPNAKINLPDSFGKIEQKTQEPEELELSEEGKRILGDPDEKEKLANTARIYFLKLNKDGEAESYISKRELKDLTLKNAINSLLKGPNAEERKAGIYTEIPDGTKLLSVINSDDKIIINFNSEFQYGGGTESINNRLKQLVKTVVAILPDKNIYLYIEGKQVDVMGGDGIMITQPLNVSNFGF